MMKSELGLVEIDYSEFAVEDLSGWSTFLGTNMGIPAVQHSEKAGRKSTLHVVDSRSKCNTASKVVYISEILACKLLVGLGSQALFGDGYLAHKKWHPIRLVSDRKDQCL